MTYVHFELLLIFGNKYSIRKILYRERKRESRDYSEAKRKIPCYGVVGLYL